MNFTEELNDSFSRHFDDAKRKVEHELFAMLQSNTSFVLGVKLVRFDNRTGFAEANFLVVINETALIRNNTMHDLRNVIANGTFMSLFIHRDFPIHVQRKSLALFNQRT